MRELTQDQVATSLGIAAATVSRWEREPGRVTVPVLRNLARVLRCDVTELLDSRPQPTHGAGYGGEILSVNAVDAGQPGAVFSVEFLRSITDADLDSIGLLRVVGDVMAPTLVDGDLCLIDCSARVYRSGLFCIRRGNAAGVRRLSLRADPEQVLVVADNSLYGPGEVVPIRDLDLIGRVIWRGGLL